jgi:hypothetical protein
MERSSNPGDSVELNFDIVPSNAPLFAEDIVRQETEIGGATLDFSIKSLVVVDEIIEDFRRQGCNADEIPATLFGFGCYLGEVFVRNAGFRWRRTTPGEMEAVTMPLAIELDGYLVNPIGKVFKRMLNGEEDYLPYFYEAASQPSRNSESWER